MRGRIICDSFQFRAAEFLLCARNTLGVVPGSFTYTFHIFFFFYLVP